MKPITLFVTWLGTAFWTVVGTGVANTIDGQPSWIALWVTIIGIPTWLSIGARSGSAAQEGPDIGTVAFVGVHTAIFLLLILLISLGCSGGFRP